MKKAEHIAIGDQLRDVNSGAVIYTVVTKQTRPPALGVHGGAAVELVVATVKFAADGGCAERVWDAGTLVPLQAGGPTPDEQVEELLDVLVKVDGGTDAEDRALAALRRIACDDGELGDRFRELLLAVL